MLFKKMTLVFSALVLLTSCQDLLNNLTLENIQKRLTPKASPEMVAMIRDKAAGLAFSPAESLGRSGKSRMTLKEGQWVTTLTTQKDAGGDVTLSTTRVISVTDQTVVMETESYSALERGERRLARITFENYPVRSDLSYGPEDADAIRNVRITAMETRTGNEPVQVMPAEALAMSQGLAQNLTGVNVRSGELIADACVGDYITSKRCYTFDFTVSVMGITQSGRSTVHSKIPVTGLVRTDTDTMIQETIAFGTSGAVSLF
ncbi:hypothetical protein JCM14469_41480 [Desulfatiferula olefinivorans]